MISRKVMISIFVIILNIGFANASTLDVGKGQAYTTIQSAIDAANTGDVISVGEGTYFENPVIKTNGISVIGKNKEKTVIDGKNTGSGIRIDQANNVKISGFTIQNSGGSGKEDAGVTLYSADNNMVTNLILVNNIAGISIYSGSDNNIISGDDIKSSINYGILIFSSGDNKIFNNNIQDNKFGIYADSARNNNIYSNNLMDNKDQAYDNSGQNSWDDGKSGNYWNDFKDSGGYSILGGAKAMDNYPLSDAVTIESETIMEPAEQKTAQVEEVKSSPGFSGIVIMLLLVAMGLSRYGKKA